MVARGSGVPDDGMTRTTLLGKEFAIPDLLI
jgi:hypothetical protein